MATRARNVRLIFIVIVPCLLIQLKLQKITEPYPAILLPSGAGLLKSHGHFTGFQTECLAEDTSSSKHPFRAATVLDAVPTNYDLHVIQRGFGINNPDRGVRRPRIPLVGFRLQLGRPMTQLQIEETRNWLRLKLRQRLGIDAVRIHILTYAITTYYDEIPTRQQRRLESRTTVELVGGEG